MTTKNLAYLDPGSAGLMIQMLIGAMAAAAVSVKLFWRRVRDVLRPHRRADRTADPRLDSKADADR